SRSVRLRRFSISASVRSSRSFISACSRSSAVDGTAACASSDGRAAVSADSWPSSSTRAVWSVIFSYRSKIRSAIGDTGAPFVSPLLWVYSPGAPHIRAQTAKIKPNVRLSTAEQFADDLGRIVDHRHDAGVVEPGRTDDAENTDDLPGRVVIGRNDRRGAR